MQIIRKKLDFGQAVSYYGSRENVIACGRKKYRKERERYIGAVLIQNNFYIGFKQFEVIPEVWGENNPCQIYVMYLKNV